MNAKRYEETSRLNRVSFRRLTGVYPETFGEMVEVLREREDAKTKTGRPAALSLEDQLLLTLEFWREYPTLFHLAHRWGLSESSASRTITRVEAALVESGRFKLPSKRVLRDETVFSVVLVDVTETPVERPKKSRRSSIAARNDDTP